MNLSPAIEAILIAAASVREIYLSTPQTLNFGAWTLQNVFPDADEATLHRARDFAGAERTSDGKTYLVGMLISGGLPLEAVLAFLHAQNKRVVPPFKLTGSPVTHRVSSSFMTPHQQSLLDSMQGDTLEIEGRLFTRATLMSIFNRQQLPRDPVVCEALGVS